MSSLRILLTLTCMFRGTVALADLYTGHIASLEWKAHSADAALIVSVAMQGAEIPRIELLEVLERDGQETRDPKEVLEIWNPPLRYHYQKDWKPDGEWLLFVRLWRNRPATIDHKIYLSNPRLASWVSAVTADGKILEDKAEILNVVKERWGRKEKLSEHERASRQHVDAGKHLSHRNRERPKSGSPESVSPWLGGFQIPVDIDIWDTPPDDRTFDEDLWVTHLTVPADAAYQAQLNRYWNNYVNLSRNKRRANLKTYPLAAFVNYPGKQTERLLGRIIEAESYRRVEIDTYLRYLQFYEPKFDRQDRQLVGSWMFSSANHEFQLDLKEGNELLVHQRPKPFPHPNRHQREWVAKGRWNLHYGKLLLRGDGLRFKTSNRFHEQSVSLPRLSHLAVIHVSPDAIKFNNGLSLVRVAKPIDLNAWQAE